MVGGGGVQEMVVALGCWDRLVVVVVAEMGKRPLVVKTSQLLEMGP